MECIYCTYAYAKAQFAYALIHAYMPAYILFPNRQVEKTFVVNLRKGGLPIPIYDIP